MPGCAGRRKYDAAMVSAWRDDLEVPSTSELEVKVFADGADLESLRSLAADPLISGFTTNPTLMRAAGISDYEAFAREAVEAVGGRPLSLEVFSDDFSEMEEQARLISTFGSNVYVKIPVTDCSGTDSTPLLRRLVDAGVHLNVTALMTMDQVRRVKDALRGGPESYVSVFAGRVADTGRDPLPLMQAAVSALEDAPEIELIWASPREILNIFQANAIGCDVITVTHDLLRKLGNVGRSLDDFSLDTVQMFRRDALGAGYQLRSVHAVPSADHS